MSFGKRKLHTGLNGRGHNNTYIHIKGDGEGIQGMGKEVWLRIPLRLRIALGSVRTTWWVIIHTSYIQYLTHSLTHSLTCTVQFIQQNGFPKGSFHLRDFNWKGKRQKALCSLMRGGVVVVVVVGYRINDETQRVDFFICSPKPQFAQRRRK